MSRPRRQLVPGHAYHITIRCNNREFQLARPPCRSVLLYALHEAQQKYGYALYAFCLMSNHAHYLLEPHQPEDLPRLMHWLNWYTGRCFNSMLRRTGHFWEQRYYSAGIPRDDHLRALLTLRYIHGNPRAAGMQRGFFSQYSNYGIYARLTDDGLTQWHPAFLTLGETLEACSARYRAFCARYQPAAKHHQPSRWGSRWLPQVARRRNELLHGEPPLLPGCGCEVTEPLFPPALRAVLEQCERANGPAHGP